MENLLNMLHYFIYRIDYKLHLYSNKINPILIIYKLPFFKRKFKERGIDDIEKEINKAFGDKENGLSSMVSGGILVGIVFISLMSLVVILLKVANIDIILSWEYFIVITLIAVLLCYFLVFKKDRYLGYFEQYKKWTKYEKIKNGLISLGFVVFVIIFFIGSLKF